MTVSYAAPEDAAAIRLLWQSAFGDSPQEIEAFLERYDPTAYALVLKEKDELCSMLFLLPTWWREERHSRLIGYIYAGATAKQWQGKGCYKRLLMFARECAQTRGMAALALRPATAALEDSYRRMGFDVPLSCRETVVTLAPFQEKALDAATYRRLRTTFLEKRCAAFVDWDETCLAHALSWCRAVQTADGVMLYTKEDDEIIVWEYLSDKPLAAAPNGVKATVRTVGEQTVVGLLLPLDGAFLPHGYLGYGLE